MTMREGGLDAGVATGGRYIMAARVGKPPRLAPHRSERMKHQLTPPGLRLRGDGGAPKVVLCHSA